MPPPARLVGAIVLWCLLLSACGGDDGDGDGEQASGPSSSSVATERFPPDDTDELIALFERQVEPLGLTITRAALVEPTERYERSPTGTHLAVYVEPTGEHTDADYVEGIFTVTDVFAPEIFERWPGLRSFDVCQEPRPGVDDRVAPKPVTVVEMTRAQVDAVDWDEADAATLVAASMRRPRGAEVTVSATIAGDPAWKEVATRAREQVDASR